MATTDEDPWVDDRKAALLVDQYELTMVQAYWSNEMTGRATFSLYTRTLPEGRNYFLAAGLEDALRYLEQLEFTDEACAYLEDRDEFRPEFVDWLSDLAFEGDVRAVREGTPVFPDEPWVEVDAPIAQAQLAETFIMNQMHFQTALASKASRVARAAGDRSVIDFGLRRMHGTDAGMKGARVFHIAGCDGTSNVRAGKVYGVPVTGTMAHAYIQSHDSEIQAFRNFVDSYPETILLVDTYDTLEGVEKVIELAEELGDDFQVRGIRLDSGDLGELAEQSREMLDEAGLESVAIFASGGLDEYEIRRLVDEGAPIDGFGVGTRMGVARDAPAFDTAYKLTGYAGKGRLKLSPGKRILPGPKQVYRVTEGDEAVHDVIARRSESREGRPLLETVMEGGERTDAGSTDLDRARERADRLIDELPERVQGIDDADPGYRVDVSDALRAHQRDVIERVESSTEHRE